MNRELSVCLFVQKVFVFVNLPFSASKRDLQFQNVIEGSVLQAADLDEEKIRTLALGLMCSYTDIIIDCNKSLDLDEKILLVLLSQPDVSCTELQLYGFLYE